MASTPVILLLKRTGNSSDRPNTATVQAGEPALSFGGADPGLYFKDSAGAIRKIGGSHYATTAPNSTPAGSAGNSVGELWTLSTGSFYLQVWTGSGWQKVGAGFADIAGLANTATTATTATTANVALECTGKVATTFTGTLPAVGVAGSLAFDTGTGTLYASDGTTWVAV
jgi:hypothetical protein